MLIYLGFGLAVTTMCIDLVGIQYIQKIHYFGRKFHGTDILQLLKRRQMIEHGLTTDQGDEFLKLYLRQLQEAAGITLIEGSKRHSCNYTSEMPTPANYDISDDNNNDGLQCISDEDEQLINKSNSNSNNEIAVSNSQNVTREQQSSLSSSQLSTLSQQQLPETVPSSVSVPLVSPSSSPIGLACMMEWDSYIEMLNESNKSFAKPENKATETFLSDWTMAISENEEYLVEHEEIVSDKERSPSSSSSSSSSTLSTISHSMQIMQPIKLELNIYETMEQANTISEILTEQNIEQTIIYYKNIPIHSIHQKTVETENALQNLLNAPESIISHNLPPVVVDDNYCFVIDGETIGSEAILHDDIHWSHTSRSTQYFYLDNLPQTFNALHSTRSTPIQQSGTLDLMPARSTSTISGFRHDTIPLVQVYVVTRIYSFWKTYPSFRRIITLLDRVNKNEMDNGHFQKRIFVQYIWRDTKQSDKDRVKDEFNRDHGRFTSCNKTTTIKLAFR
uniref:RING-type domain-containing protein n=2 Tax=Loa loa TaxID=7209 RepID=A0A1I7W3C2_LOALO